jgi:phosphonate transport system substrate-binding protein
MFTGCEDQGATPTYEPSGVSVEKRIYKVGIHPYLNSKKMFRSYRPILDLLEERIGNVEFRLETSVNYAAYNVKLYRGDFDFSLPNPFQTYNALSKNYHVIAKMKPDVVFRGIFVARKSSRLRSVGQLKGKRVSFPAPTALAATMMPLYYLHEQGLDVNHDIEKQYVGSQYSSIMNAYSGDTVAGATWPPPWEAWVKENPQKAEEMEVVWQTQPLINNGFVVRNDIDAALADKVVSELVALSAHDAGMKLLANAGFEGFETADDDDYDVVRSFLLRYDDAIGIPK